ncbi:uncharacterized protein [Asterias amurensis]|uniref:uncharacterized protein n=1 Tax=Asterias amurensis TaxID=7602 RepID=UPI003AB8510A
MLKVKFPGMAVARKGKETYRKYSPDNLDKALAAVTDEGFSVKKASRIYAVPYSTVYDRVNGRIKKLQCTKSGPDPLLSVEEEQTLVTYIELMASFGYEYSRTEVTSLATDLAVRHGLKKKSEKPLSLQWFYSFMKRWPELKVKKPKSLEIMRTKATSLETVNKYFDELEHILEKHNLVDRPQAIYIVDETSITEHHKPPSCIVLPSHQATPPEDTIDESTTTTVIGCGNAVGMAVPPFFIFKGPRMRKEFLKGCTTGTAGAASDSGKSSSDTFKRYLDHFSKYRVPATPENPVLVLYDEHKCNVSLSLIQWAREERNIILFVLPAYTSHILQPMDVGCFGPFENILNDLRKNAPPGVAKHSPLCALACKAYTAAFTPSNLHESFRRMGIYPVDRCSVEQSSFRTPTKATPSTSVMPDVSSDSDS